MRKGMLEMEYVVDGLPSAEIDPAEVVDLAERLLKESIRRQRWSEKSQSRQLARMMDDDAGKAFTFAMADEVFRPPTNSRRARRFHDLISRFGVPHYLPLTSRLALGVGGEMARIFPDGVMPQVMARLRRESASVVLSADRGRLAKHVRRRHQQNMRLIFNQLGETVLGEAEASRRMKANLDRLADVNCDAVSVKLSAIYSQIHPVADRETLEELKTRLRELYRAAMRHRRVDGRPKFVNLDMEEYRDLTLTCTAFIEVLSEEEFREMEAGIVLQAYLSDSWPVMKALNKWALERVENGGTAIKVRLVKGANLAMERVEAEWHGWPLAPYPSKVEVDANYKRLLQEACRRENFGVRVGVASHNLFDIAYALLLREKNRVQERVQFEMLEGMANHQARVVRDEAGELLLYAPVVEDEDFPSAIAYLIRRLDENTSPENFLHDLFGMKPGDAAWERQKERFLAACKAIPTTPWVPSRQQDRATEQPRPRAAEDPFENVPDTDFALEQNARWVRDQVAVAKEAKPVDVPLQIGGIRLDGAGRAETTDPSRPGVVVCRHALAGPDEVDEALEVAVNARRSWMARSPEERSGILLAAAAELSKARGEAITTMVREAGKAVMEADVEVSEAIDFANYYARSLKDEGWWDGSGFEPCGPVVVTPPWNFPFAIPCGGVLAPLAAGTSVILKPAPQTVLTAWVLVETLWRAGVPREVLQFVPCPDDETGRRLVTDERLGAVILTGGYETARAFVSWRPGIPLMAETSGKNALVITAAADPDLAVKDLVRSAFGHAGQKCSAASLAIVEAEVYDDPDFQKRLLDAAASLKRGGSWDLAAVVTPVIEPPTGNLLRALTQLDDGESWLLKPEVHPEIPNLWSPGIRLGVKPDSWFRRTECFGPVLGVIRAQDLDHAIAIQNDSDFGLTGGIHSLDPEEVERWQQGVEVGNAYINRPITGAIVQRQPFGGWKRSSFGPGAKAGGPNYVAQFGVWTDVSEPTRRAPVSAAVAAILKVDSTHEFQAAAESDAWWMKHEFSVAHDPSALACEANIFRYRVRGRVLLRSPEEREIRRMVLAALATGRAPGDLEISLAEGQSVFDWMRSLKVVRESDKQLAKRLAPGSFGILRVVDAADVIRLAAAESGLRLLDAAPVSNGRIELLRYLHEQAVSRTMHRHGSLVTDDE